MKLNDRIYSRKVLWRIIYIYNFIKLNLFKELYLEFADKIDNIVHSWVNRTSVDNINYKFLNSYNALADKIDTNNYLKMYSYFLDTDSKEFNDLLLYVCNSIKKKEIDNLEYDYINKNFVFFVKNYEILIETINKFLPKFKFYELESITQSVLLLMKVENDVFKTEKPILIKEAIFIADKFTSDSNMWLIQAVLDKILV